MSHRQSSGSGYVQDQGTDQGQGLVPAVHGQDGQMVAHSLLIMTFCRRSP